MFGVRPFFLSLPCSAKLRAVSHNPRNAVPAIPNTRYAKEIDLIFCQKSAPSEGDDEKLTQTGQLLAGRMEKDAGHK